MKKYIGFIVAALFASNVAMAELVANKSVVLFGDVALGQVATDSVRITNIGANVIEGITVSISGNSKEYDSTDCQSRLFSGESCVIIVTLTPLNYGTKRRKLTIDGVQFLVDGSTADISLSIDLAGTSDNPNKP